MKRNLYHIMPFLHVLHV